MTRLYVNPYEESALDEWERVVDTAPMGTLLHSRAFFSHHGARFADASVLFYDAKGKLVGAMPAAAQPDDPTVVVSHPGATFGGIVHDGSITGAAMLDAMNALVGHYQEAGYHLLRYAPVPFIYHRQPSCDDLYALFRLGAARARCDLSCAVDLQDRPTPSSRRRRGLQKAGREGVDVLEGSELLDELWPLVETNLARRHNAKPVHTQREIKMLIDLLPDAVHLVVGRYRGDSVAGVVLFDGPRVSHAQYIASIEIGNRVGALDAVFDYCLSRAAARGARFFDFGTSNREEGRVLNDGLYDFKAQFGGGGVAYERYELNLREN